MVINGKTFGYVNSDNSSDITLYTVKADGVKELMLEPVGLDTDEWISLLEVRVTQQLSQCKGVRVQ